MPASYKNRRAKQPSYKNRTLKFCKEKKNEDISMLIRKQISLSVVHYLVMAPWIGGEEEVEI